MSNFITYFTGHLFDGLTMLGLTLIHVSKRGPWYVCPAETHCCPRADRVRNRTIKSFRGWNGTIKSPYITVIFLQRIFIIDTQYFTASSRYGVVIIVEFPIWPFFPYLLLSYFVHHCVLTRFKYIIRNVVKHTIYSNVLIRTSNIYHMAYLKS